MARATRPEPFPAVRGGRFRDGSVGSVLWPETPDSSDLPQSRPAYFPDLHLDGIVEGLLAGIDGIDGDDVDDLRRVYFQRLREPDGVRYRQEVFGDLEEPQLLAAVSAFTRAMRTVRQLLATAAGHHRSAQAARWHLDAAEVYGQAVEALSRQLAAGNLRSRALVTLRAHTADLVRSPRFRELRSECSEVLAALAAIRYCLHVRGSRVTVTGYRDEPDYAASLRRTFEAFSGRAAHDYRIPLVERERMDPVEAQVLDRVAGLFAREFADLERFHAKWREFVDPALGRFEREVRFYVAYLDWTRPLRSAGLPLCYPEVGQRGEACWASGSYDLALGRTRALEGGTVVGNDFSLDGDERLLVVTGPNRGGKSTFARMFGQLHHLAALGCPVPGSAARLRLCDQIFTSFQRAEDPAAAAGRLEQELRALRAVLLEATADSVLVVNEMFTSATLRDATFLGQKLVERACEIGLVGVVVTFVEELASLNASTVSMVSTVTPEDPSVRTFELRRSPPAGRSYAATIAREYGLSYEQLAARLAR